MAHGARKQEGREEIAFHVNLFLWGGMKIISCKKTGEEYEGGSKAMTAERNTKNKNTMKTATEETMTLRDQVMDQIDKNNGRLAWYQSHRILARYGASPDNWLPEWGQISRIFDTSETDEECQGRLRDFLFILTPSK